jgi:hypothetical protein
VSGTVGALRVQTADLFVPGTKGTT